MAITDARYFVTKAETLYAEIRDLSKSDATHVIAKALLDAYGVGCDAVFADLRANPILRAATPKEAR